MLGEKIKELSKQNVNLPNSDILIIYESEASVGAPKSEVSMEMLETSYVYIRVEFLCPRCGLEISIENLVELLLMLISWKTMRIH